MTEVWSHRCVHLSTLINGILNTSLLTVCKFYLKKPLKTNIELKLIILKLKCLGVKYVISITYFKTQRGKMD